MDQQKIEQLKELLNDIHSGLDPEEAQLRFQRDLGSVDARTLAQAENALLADGMPLEKLQGLCSVHAAVAGKNVEAIHEADHFPGPLKDFLAENDALETFLQTTFKPTAHGFFFGGGSLESFLEALEQLEGLSVHYDRKENIFFPILEEQGVTSIPQVMWGVDDDIREMVRDVKKGALEGADANVLHGKMPQLLQEISGMIAKERDVLAPLLMESFDAEDWNSVAADRSYPLQFGVAASPFKEMKGPKREKKSQEAPAAPQNRGVSLGGQLNFPMGSLSFEQVDDLFQNIPAEVTYVNENDIVQYVSDREEMIFPRPSIAIGRDVFLCHPPKSHAIVREVMDDLRSGRKDQVVRIFTRGEALLLVRYIAVRDRQGIYRGVLELVEDLRAIEGMDEYLK
ncbi:MAG: DUF438 domain-containing protein [Tissierellia bacterium]|nr:DUF438 domain-containing protein [Tissierellia bacterium]